MNDRAHALELLDDEPPARTRLDRERRLPLLEPSQPQPQVLTIRRSDPAPRDLTRLAVEIVERDLPTMKIQPANDGHIPTLPSRMDDNDPPIVHRRRGRVPSTCHLPDRRDGLAAALARPV